MPVKKRSRVTMTKKRRCIEAETPLAPKNNGAFEKKKRKLEQEFSTECHVNQQLEKSCKKTAHMKHTTRHTDLKSTDVLWTQHYGSAKEKNVQQGRLKNCTKDISPSRNQKKSQKSAKSKHIDSTNHTHDSQVVNSSEWTKSMKNRDQQHNYNQKRVSKAIEDISGNTSSENYSNGKEDYMRMQDSVDHCSSTKLSTTENTKVEVPMVELSEGKESDIREETGEEDYQRKYFQLLDMMKGLQDEFLMSQKNFEQHVAANDAFVEEMKIVLEEKNKELSCTKEELSLCKSKNSELENRVGTYDQDIEALNRKVQEMTAAHNVSQNFHDDESEKILQAQIDDQKTMLELYNVLTGLSLKKVPSSAEEDEVLSVCDSFYCSMKPGGNEEMEFVLSQDREFAEIEYRPLSCVSTEENEERPRFPAYLREQIFFADDQAPKFLLRLMQAVHEPQKK